MNYKNTTAIVSQSNKNIVRTNSFSLENSRFAEMVAVYLSSTSGIKVSNLQALHILHAVLVVMATMCLIATSVWVAVVMVSWSCAAVYHCSLVCKGLFDEEA